MFCTPMFEELLYVINRYTESEDRGYRLPVIAVIYKKKLKQSNKQIISHVKAYVCGRKTSSTRVTLTRGIDIYSLLIEIENQRTIAYVLPFQNKINDFAA